MSGTQAHLQACMHEGRQAYINLAQDKIIGHEIMDYDSSAQSAIYIALLKLHAVLRLCRAVGCIIDCL